MHFVHQGLAGDREKKRIATAVARRTIPKGKTAFLQFIHDDDDRGLFEISDAGRLDQRITGVSGD